MKHVLVCVIVGAITVAAMVAAHQRPGPERVTLRQPIAASINYPAWIVLTDGDCPNGYKPSDIDVTKTMTPGTITGSGKNVCALDTMATFNKKGGKPGQWLAYDASEPDGWRWVDAPEGK